MIIQDGKIRAAISAHELISFDVFDTLILRKVSRPIDVFSLVKLTLITTRDAFHHQLAVDAFPELRVRAEQSARERKRKRSGTREVTLDEIYCEIAQLSQADTDAIELLKKTELECEHSVVYPNPVMKAVLETARAQGKPVVFCSDMYLPAATIASLLERCGYTGGERIYVSCEHSLSKHDGSMFRYIAEQHGISTNKILHFGDNEHADYAMAKQAGCAAIHIPYQRPSNTVSIPMDREHPFYSQTVGAIVQGILKKRSVLEAAATNGSAPSKRVGHRPDPWEQVGFKVFGPLFTGFLVWIANIAQERKPEKILLCARDSYFLWKNLDPFIQHLGIEVEYLYVSRGALLLPSLTDFSLPRLWHLFSGKSRKSVATYLKQLGLEPAMMSGMVRSAGFESLEETVTNLEPRMHEFLAKLHPLLMRESARRRPLVQQYLKAAVGDARRIMLVDIGWVGNIQASFVRLLGSGHPNMEVKGYYMGLHRYARENDMLGHTMEGWLTNYGNPAAFEKDVWWSGGVELLEFAMCAPHGTTLGYEESDDGKIVPVLESGGIDSSIRELAVRVQAGASAFLEEFLASHRGVPAAALASRGWANEFYRLVTEPTPDEAALLGDLTHSDAAGDTVTRLPLAPKVRRFRPADLAKSWDEAFWKAGFRVRNGLRRK